MFKRFNKCKCLQVVYLFNLLNCHKKLESLLTSYSFLSPILKLVRELNCIMFDAWFY